ncbi:MAG: 23S rRNA (guanosine(2251)-2'-O)-methyltransferase RlmB [Hyphomicrobiaceae bacterium]
MPDKPKHHGSGPPRNWRKTATGKPRGPKSGAPREHRAGRASSGADDREGPVLLYGLHAVAAALANPSRRVIKVMASENAERRLANEIASRGIAVERVQPKALDRILGPDAVHQGILAEVAPLEPAALNDLAARARDGLPIVLLDQVTDPHNVGAVLRSAAVFGAAGLVLTQRHSPPLNGTLAKAASGALELVPIAVEQNLSRTLEHLKELGVTVVGLDGEADGLVEDAPLTGPLAFVLGAEGKGLRLLTRQTCDRLCRIATSATLASLNVSNAAAVALHLAHLSRSGRLGPAGPDQT